LLGDKIKDLPKDERKLVKATDAERQARRMAKKKARVSMERGEAGQKGAVKINMTRTDRDKRGKPDKAKKSRVRSSNALKNMKGSRE
jgi:nucleolar protein 12